MRFLFDANFPRKAQHSVRVIFRQHEFTATATEPFHPEMEDLELFDVAAREGIEVIIIHDIAQMTGIDRRDERAKCHDSNIHWLGLPQAFRAKGSVAKASSVTGALISSLPYAISVFEAASEPTAILLRGGITTLQAEQHYPQPIKLPR